MLNVYGIINMDEVIMKSWHKLRKKLETEYLTDLL